MNRIVTILVAALVMFGSGCMTEAERQALEKQRREQYEAQKRERAEREKLRQQEIEKEKQAAAEREKLRQQEIAKEKQAAAERKAKEEAAGREKYWSDVAERNYELIILGQENPEDYIVAPIVNKVDLSKWIAPRNGICDDLKMKGRALIETFASRYMPNAFVNYEKMRDSADEVQQMFNEEFPNAKVVKPTDPSWIAYCKMLKAFSIVRTKYFRAHDELCHFYVLYKCGAVSAADLARIDAAKINVRLFEGNFAKLVFNPEEFQMQSKASDEENPMVSASRRRRSDMAKGRDGNAQIGEKKGAVNPVDEKTLSFAAKYAPETHALYAKLMEDRTETLRLFNELKSEMRLMDVFRFEIGYIALCEKINYETRTIRDLANELKGMFVEHKTMQKSAEEIAKYDQALAGKWNGYVEALSKFVKARCESGLIDVSGVMSKWYENDKLTLWQWNAALGASKAWKTRNSGDDMDDTEERGGYVALPDPFVVLYFGEDGYQDYFDEGLRIDCGANLYCGIDAPYISRNINKEIFVAAGSDTERMFEYCMHGYVGDAYVHKVKGSDALFYAAATGNVPLEDEFDNANIKNQKITKSGDVLVAEYSIASIVVACAKYRIAAKDNYGKITRCEKVCDISPTPIFAMINRHTPAGVGIRVVLVKNKKGKDQQANYWIKVTANK